MNKTNIWTKWYAIIIYCIIGLALLSIALGDFTCEESNNDCSNVRYELQECQEKIIKITEGWDNYMLAMDEYQSALKDYCDIDYTNPLCSVLIQ